MVFKDKIYAIIALALILLGNAIILAESYFKIPLGIIKLSTPMCFAGNLLGFVFLVSYGTVFYRKWYSQILKGLIGISIIGMLFKIQHWPAANTMLLAGFGGIAVLYMVHFITKPKKQLLDISKLVLVASYFIHGVLVLFHLPFSDVANVITIAAFFITLLIVVLYKEKSGVL